MHSLAHMTTRILLLYYMFEMSCMHDHACIQTIEKTFDHACMHEILNA